jgi:hypothetical protein
MADAFRGLYRTVAWAYVTNGAMAFQVPEAQYRALGYEPQYNRLPWSDDYIAPGHCGRRGTRSSRSARRKSVKSL